MRKWFVAVVLFVIVPFLQGCQDSGPSRIYTAANGCYSVGAFDAEQPLSTEFLAVSDGGATYEFLALGSGNAEAFFLKPSALATYLLYDEAGSYLVSDGDALQRAAELESDVLLIDDSFQSPAEWELVAPQIWGRRLHLRHRLSGRYLAKTGLVDNATQAAEILLVDSPACAEFPEASLDADGQVEVTEFPDGSLFGFVDTHSHILSNFGFGGGGIFHGAAFHRLGIEHALSDCELFHGEEGRKDLFGFGFDNPDDTLGLLLAFIFGQTIGPNHATAGYPDFTDWPSAHDSSTHQVQYYKWLERAYLGGLRLVVQHATSNQMICDFMVGGEIQSTRYGCNDMVAVDRIIDETYAMESYIDAQEGGPGQGWFRIVTTPDQARQTIRVGKMAVILGIETSNLFDCFLVIPDGFTPCTEQDVIDKLDAYHARGVRALFPVHKYDNGFFAGDGNKGVIELGNFIQTGHFSNFSNECDAEVPTVFDRGPASFPGLIGVRDDYFGPPPFDLSNFANDPVGTLLPFFPYFLVPPTGEEVCQVAGITPLGEFLVEQVMNRGMILEIDHLPRHGYERVFEMLEQNDYPAAGTHGLNHGGRLYALGGISKAGFSTCRSETQNGTVDDAFQARIALIEDNGGFPAEGFGLDLNGFAGAPGPRFGPDNVCGSTLQEDPVTYPFTSYAGDVVFSAPQLGNRPVDFNTEGLAHIGLLPELIDDVRRDGVTDLELEPLFKSAEGYIRMWEKAESQGASLRGE